MVFDNDIYTCKDFDFTFFFTFSPLTPSVRDVGFQTLSPRNIFSVEIEKLTKASSKNIKHNGNISDAASSRLPTFQLPWARIWQSSGRLTVKVVIILIIVIITINTIKMIIRVIETLSGPTCTSAASPRTPPTRTSSTSAKSETSLFFLAPTSLIFYPCL